MNVSVIFHGSTLEQGRNAMKSGVILCRNTSVGSNDAGRDPIMPGIIPISPLVTHSWIQIHTKNVLRKMDLRKGTKCHIIKVFDKDDYSVD